MKCSSVPLSLVKIFSDGRVCSVNYLSKLLKVSAQDINTHIKTIQEWGVDVLPISNKSYILSHPMQLLKRESILDVLDKKDIIILPIVNSTNQYLLDRVSNLETGDACIAEYQQAGRGRRGRSWVSSFGAHLCLSIFWKFNHRLITTVGLSLVIGIVIAKVLLGLGIEGVRVKWPNDLYLKNRKLAGILIEVVEKMNDCICLVIGVGINLTMYRTNLSNIKQSWISLEEVGLSINRNILAAVLLNHLRKSMRQFEHFGLAPFLVCWNSLDEYVNQPVKLLLDKKQVFGISRGINHQGALLLDQKGVIKSFFSGEISLRRISKV